MSVYRLKRQGEQIVFGALKGAKWAYNAHDIDWHNIKVSVKVRGRSGMNGDNAFTFTTFGKEEVVFVLVGIDGDKQYFWVTSQRQLEGKQSFYASLKTAVTLKEVPKIVKLLASHGKEN